MVDRTYLYSFLAILGMLYYWAYHINGWTFGRDWRQYPLDKETCRVSVWDILRFPINFRHVPTILFLGFISRHEQNWTDVFPVNTLDFSTCIYIYISHHVLPMISHQFTYFPHILPFVLSKRCHTFRVFSEIAARSRRGFLQGCWWRSLGFYE